MPTVSVILLSYNQGEYIADSIESVLSQTYDDWELLVVDNGSTDSTSQVLDRYEGRDRVKIVRHPQNDKLTQRLNDALTRTTGRYISLLYSDDYYLPHKLSLQVALFASAATDVGAVHSPGYRLDVRSGERWLDPCLPVTGDALVPLLEGLGSGLFINPIAFLFKRECLEQFPYNEELFLEGESIVLRYAIGFHFLFDPEPTVVMRDHERNIGRSVRRNYTLLFEQLDFLGKHPRFPESARMVLNRTCVHVARRAGWEGVRSVNDPTWAREMFGRAIRADLRQLVHPKILAGLGLSLLPDRARRTVHETLLRLRGARGHANYVAEYRR